VVAVVERLRDGKVAEKERLRGFGEVKLVGSLADGGVLDWSEAVAFWSADAMLPAIVERDGAVESFFLLLIGEVFLRDGSGGEGGFERNGRWGLVGRRECRVVEAGVILFGRK
jgi:hypothetical protein